MNIIKNINKIAHLLTPAQIERLEAGAKLHLRNSNITFKVLAISGNILAIRTEQGKHSSENYADVKTLITRTKELFGSFFPGHSVHTSPVIFQKSLVERVDAKWINDQMLTNGIKVKQIAADTGVDRTNISAWINDKREMSQPVKALFYYYFESKFGRG